MPCYFPSFILFDGMIGVFKKLEAKEVLKDRVMLSRVWKRHVCCSADVLSVSNRHASVKINFFDEPWRLVMLGQLLPFQKESSIDRLLELDIYQIRLTWWFDRLYSNSLPVNLNDFTSSYVVLHLCGWFVIPWILKYVPWQGSLNQSSKQQHLSTRNEFFECLLSENHVHKLLTWLLDWSSALANPNAYLRPYASPRSYRMPSVLHLPQSLLAFEPCANLSSSRSAKVRGGGEGREASAREPLKRIR